jgi:hypothetical protein
VAAKFPWEGGTTKKFAYKLMFKPFTNIFVDRPGVEGIFVKMHVMFIIGSVFNFNFPGKKNKYKWGRCVIFLFSLPTLM